MKMTSDSEGALPISGQHQARARRIDRIKPALRCPGCSKNLNFLNDYCECEHCDTQYPVRDGRIYFVQVSERDDYLDSLKGRLKSILGSAYYTWGVQLMAPTFPFRYGRKIRSYVDPSQQIVVDLGSGNNRVDEDIICLDLFDYDEVDIVCDLTNLPFAPETIDAFASRSLLEHVPHPWQLTEAIGRCTRKGGLGLHLIPFLYPYHASPYDFTRFTHTGATALFPGWQMIEQINATGPVTYFLVGLIEFLATIVSFGSRKIRGPLYLALCALLFPIKFLDAPFIGRKAFLAMAPSILTVQRKP